MERLVPSSLLVVVAISLSGSPSAASGHLSGGVGVGVWRFVGTSASLDTVLDGGVTTGTVSAFAQYEEGPYLLGLRVGYLKKELPKGLRQSRSTGAELVVDDPSSLRCLPVTLEFGLESRGDTRARLGAGVGFAALWHKFLPSAFAHAPAEDQQEVRPAFRLAGGVSRRWGRAVFGVEVSYLTLLSAERSISKIPAEVLHGVALELRLALR